MADIEAAYRSLILCINEGRWEDLPRYMHYDFIKNGQDYTPESYAAEMRSASGVELAIDALTVDRESQRRLAATILVKVNKTANTDENAAELPGRPVSFMEHHFNWFTEGGKLSKTLILTDRDEMHRQLADPGATYTPDLISQQPPAPTASSPGSDGSGNKVPSLLSSPELEDTYRAYIGCINAQTMGTELPRFCHARVVHNTKTLALDRYRLLMEDAFAAIPDLVFGLDTVVADEVAQRVAARIEFSGTPVGPHTLAGVKPNGRSVSFAEHVTYSFVDGKIARVWSIVDLASYRAQLSA